MATAVYIESFNNKLHEFMNDLVETFPELRDLRLMKSSFIMVKSINPKLPQQIFNDHVANEFEDSIVARDEKFFMDYDYDVILQKVQQHGGDNVAKLDAHGMNIVGYLKNIWKDLSNDNKDVIWKYLAVLLILNKKCRGA